jgi:hypothetical protein
MCNCGNKDTSPMYTAAPAAAQHRQTTAASPEVYSFQYTGDATLTTKGSATGATYHFSYKGAVQAVHHRDAGGLLKMPNLLKLG